MKIEFKPLNSVKLDKTFPVISKEDYALIAGQTLIISDKEWESIQKKGSIQIGSYQISQELIQIAKGENYDPIEQKILNEVREKAIFFDPIVDIMIRANRLEQNALFYGRGGHNKSEGIELILDLMMKEKMINEKPFVMTCGDGLTEEGLFGGINIKKFKDSGELEYLFHNSFLDHETVIFEEIFDAPPQVLLALKDVMTSGYARKGNQVYKCKTKVFIGLTNKSKESFSEDDSLEALTQRFPLTYKVEWEDYSKNNFIKLFKTVFGETVFESNKSKLQELADIISMNNVAQTSFVSPRTAIHAAKLYMDGGDLSYISDIDKALLKKYYKENKDREAEENDNNMFAIISNYIENNSLGELDSNAELLKLILNEHKNRTGVEMVIEENESSKKIKIAKLEFVLGLMDIHPWAAKNIDRAGKKKVEIKELISNLNK